MKKQHKMTNVGRTLVYPEAIVERSAFNRTANAIFESNVGGIFFILREEDVCIDKLRLRYFLKVSIFNDI